MAVDGAYNRLYSAQFSGAAVELDAAGPGAVPAT
jgi:hypothetical protein